MAHTKKNIHEHADARGLSFEDAWAELVCQEAGEDIRRALLVYRRTIKRKLENMHSALAAIRRQG